MLSPELIKQIRQIELKAGYLATDALAGEYTSAFKGTGIEFEKVREYIPGDEVRTIDWNVTARMNAPFVKVYQEERELTLMLAVDVSASQYFGTDGRFKNEVAAELGAVLAFLATKNNDKVGLVVFSDHVETYVPPKKGRGHVWQIIRTLLSHRSTGHGTDLDGVCQFLSRSLKRKSMCFLISDFQDVGTPKSLQVLARKHDLTCVQTFDQAEREMERCGLLNVVDAETGEELFIDTSDAAVRQQFLAESAGADQQLIRTWQRLGIDGFSLPSTGSLVDPLMRYLRKRERRR